MTSGVGDSDPPPTILFARPRITDLIYSRHRAKKLMDEEWGEDDEDRSYTRFTTAEQPEGAEIWEEGELNQGGLIPK